MNEHHEYTIAGTTYYAVGNRLYVETGKVHELTDVDDHPFHLIDGILETAWKHLPADGFEGAVALEAVRPDGIHECPECGGWVGPKDKEPTCLGCGYGTEEVSDNDE
jgi:hypothetical protein